MRIHLLTSGIFKEFEEIVYGKFRFKVRLGLNIVSIVQYWCFPKILMIHSYIFGNINIIRD